MSRIGFHIPYTRSEATFMCFQVGRLALDMGFDVEIYPVDTPTFSSPSWDRRLMRPAKTKFEDWAMDGLQQVYYIKPPPVELVEAYHKVGTKVNVILLWEELEGRDDNSLRVVDRVIAPSKAVAKHYAHRLNLHNMRIVPWDSGVPITFEPRDVDPNRLGVIWSLENSQLVRQEPSFIGVANALVEECSHVWLTVVYSNSLPSSSVKELKNLVKFGDGRVELMQNLSVDKQELLYGRHDLTLWPSLVESAGTLGLTSLAMGTPVLAFDHPVIGEIVHDFRNGRLVACDLNVANETDLPCVKPNYPLFGRQLVEMLRDVDRLTALRSTAVHGMRERRDNFMTSWKKLLCE